MYHQLCRKAFVHKKSLSNLSKVRLTATPENNGQSKREVRKPQPLNVEAKCIICEGNKYTKTRASEPLRQCEQLRVMESIKHSASKKHDFKMMWVTYHMRTVQSNFICTMLAIIGKRFNDAGLRDIDIESGVISRGSIDQVLVGRHYNCGARFHKLMFATFRTIQWTNYRKKFV